MKSLAWSVKVELIDLKEAINYIAKSRLIIYGLYKCHNTRQLKPTNPTDFLRPVGWPPFECLFQHFLCFVHIPVSSLQISLQACIRAILQTTSIKWSDRSLKLLDLLPVYFHRKRVISKRSIHLPLFCCQTIKLRRTNLLLLITN